MQCIAYDNVLREKIIIKSTRITLVQADQQNDAKK